MHPRPPTRESSRGIHRCSSVTRDNPQKRGSGIALPTTQAGSNGLHDTPIMTERPARGFARSSSTGVAAAARPEVASTPRPPGTRPVPSLAKTADAAHTRRMEFTVGLDTIVTLLTVVVGVVGLGGTVLASSVRTRRDLKGDMTKLETSLKSDIARVETSLTTAIARVETGLTKEIGRVETSLAAEIGRVETNLTKEIARVETSLKGDISRLDDRVYALAAGLAPRLAPAAGAEPA